MLYPDLLGVDQEHRGGVGKTGDFSFRVLKGFSANRSFRDFNHGQRGGTLSFKDFKSSGRSRAL